MTNKEIIRRRRLKPSRIHFGAAIDLSLRNVTGLCSEIKRCTPQDSTWTGFNLGGQNCIKKQLDQLASRSNCADSTRTPFEILPQRRGRHCPPGNAAATTAKARLAKVSCRRLGQRDTHPAPNPSSTGSPSRASNPTCWPSLDASTVH
jgi:hypothetical protein